MKGNNNKQESIIGKLLGVRLSGIAFTTYWDIIVTNEAVYFLKIRKSTFPFPGGVNAFQDASYMSQFRAEKDEDLSYYLSQAKEKIKVEKDQLEYIDFKEGFIKDKVVVNTADETYSFKLSSEDINLLRSSIEELKSIGSSQQKTAREAPQLEVLKKSQSLQKEEDFSVYLDRWSWGAFSLSYIWMFANKLYRRALLYLLPVLIPWGLQSLITYLWSPSAYPTFLIVTLSMLSPIGLLLVITYLGRNGRKIAWNCGQWKNAEEFQKRQEIFDKIGAAFLIILVVCAVLLA